MLALRHPAHTLAVAAALAAIAAVPAPGAVVPAGIAPAIVTGTSPTTTVKAFTPAGTALGSLTPYAAGSVAGVRVALGDVNKDGRSDVITAPSELAGPVKVFIGGKLARSFYPYGPGYAGGVNVAAGDVTGDGHPDIVTGPRSGVTPNVRVFDGVTGGQVASFFAYSPSYLGGVTVAAADLTGDRRAEIITGTGSGAGLVNAFSPTNLAMIRSFSAYGPAYKGGVNVASRDVNGDGVADIVTAPVSGAAPNVKVFSGKTGALLKSFFADDPGYTGGLDVAAGDVNGDKHADIVTGRGSRVRVFDAQTNASLGSFDPYGTPTGAVAVAVGRLPK